MTSYTGTQRAPNSADTHGGLPYDNPWNNYSVSNFRDTRVFEIVLQPGEAQDAIGTDDYTFTIIDSCRRGYVADSCWLVFPIGCGRSATVYNTYAVYNDTTKMFESTSVQGITALLPFEVARCSSVADRTLATNDTVTLKVTGTSTGRDIPMDARVFLRCTLA